MLGVKLGPGRTSHYERIIRYWKDSYKTAFADEAEEIFPNFVSSMFEIHDFVKIYEAFKEEEPSELKGIIKKLQKGVNGPINAHEETPESTSARNFIFEAAVAARLHRPNRGTYTLLNATSDTGVRIEDRKIWIECKRVTTPEKIEANVRKASRQLETVFRRQLGSGHTGLVALDVSKILNSGDKIYVRENDSQLMQSLDDLIRELIDHFSPIWERIYTRRDKKIIGTILTFQFMSTSEERNLLVYASQWGLNPRAGIAEVDKRLERKLVSMLENPP